MYRKLAESYFVKVGV